MIEQWLSEEELYMQNLISAHGREGSSPFESLAACRELMKKHEWVWNSRVMEHRCLCCEAYTTDPNNGEHKLDCAWAKQINGFPRKVGSDD